MQRKKYSYIAEKYRQGASELELYSFCANAGEIYEWGGVPAKTERFHGGFQRALSSRHSKIKKFFDDGQASPTSIVVAFREGTLNSNPLGFPSAWPSNTKTGRNPDFCLLDFVVEPFGEDTDLDVLANQVAQLLKPRLELSVYQTETNEPQELNLDNEVDEEYLDTEETEEEDTEEDQTEELDVGHSKLKSFFDFITDTSAMKYWLSSQTSRFNELKARETKSKKEREFLEYTPEQRLRSVLISLLRPATIVDGQHRIWGAYHSDQPDIVFSVCAMRDTNWIEQVFQFVVLNKLAKPISTSFLTGLLNTSLTNLEVKEIELRLENIGIKNVDRKIIKYINYDVRSPFCGMIADAGEVAGNDNKGKLSDKGMIKLAKRWKGISNQKLEISMFRMAINASNITTARKAWQDYEVWVPFFYEFWNRIKRRYESEGIWVKEVKFYLLYIVTMHVLQDAFLEDQSGANKEFESIEQFGDAVDKYFKDVPSTFFTSWETTGLQSGDGPRWIQEAISQLRKGAKLNKLRETSELYRKKDK